MSHTNIKGIHSTVMKNNQIKYYSTLERDFMFILDFDLNVDYYKEQPCLIPYKKLTNTCHYYTPDFIVYYRRDIESARKLKHLLCEIKYLRELKEKAKELERKFIAAEKYALKHGWEFRVFTEKEIRTAYLSNIRFLKRYRNVKFDYQSTMLLEMIYELREADPQSLISAVYSDEWNKAQLIPSLWHLISIGMLGTDLQMPLTMSSRIWTMMS